MSRKFIDDHVELKLTQAPSTTATLTGYDRGHLLVNSVDGTRFVNQGNANAAIFGNFPANRYELVETFQHAPLLNASVGVASNLDFEILGTNAANTGSTFADGGGVTLTTTTASGDQVIILPHLDTKQSAWATAKWNTGDRVVFETNIKTAASIASAVIWAGLKLTNTSTVATDDDQVFVRYAAGTASGVFQFITSNTGVDTTTNTSVTVAVSTAYHIKIAVDANRIPRLFINGALVATGAALKADTDLIPYVGVETATTAAKAITVRGLRLSKDLND